MLLSIFFILLIDVFFNIIIVILWINYYVGENVDLKCIFDGNLLLNYIWMFNFIEIINSLKYSIFDDKFKLLFIFYIIDNGNY